MNTSSKTPGLFRRLTYKIPIFRSLKAYIFLLMLIIGIVPSDIMRLGILNNYEERAVNLRGSDVASQYRIIANHLVNYNYLQNPTSDVVNAELEQMSNLYDGRVLIINSNFRIVKDTYAMSEGKTMISEEVIKCFRGESTTRYDKTNGYIEMTVPITETVDGEKGQTSIVRGVILASASTDSIATTLDILSRKALILEIVMGIIIIGIVFFFSHILIMPFKRVTQAISEVKDGFTDEPISVPDYLETEHIVDAFNQLLGRMKVINDSRQEFVSNVSHELKTPMTSIKVLADSLNQQPDVPVELYQEFMQDITEEIERENKIINDLLSLVKMDKTEGSMDISAVDINELLSSTEKSVEEIEQQPGVMNEVRLYRNTFEDDHIACDWGSSFSIDNRDKYAYVLPDSLNLGWIEYGGDYAALTADNLPLGNVYGFSENLLNKMDIIEGERDVSVLKEKLWNGNNVILVSHYNDKGNLSGGADNVYYFGLSVGDTIQFYENGVPTEAFTVIAKAAVTSNEMTLTGGGDNIATDVGGPKIYMSENKFKEIYETPTLYGFLFDVEEQYQQDMENYLMRDTDVSYNSISTLKADVLGMKNVVLLVGGMIGAVFALVGLINFINLVMTNIVTRRHEFATMQSIGMTNRQLRKMMISESFSYVLLAGIVGTLAAAALGMTLLRAFVENGPTSMMMTFQITLLPALIMLILFLALAFIVPVVALRLFNNRSVVERLRVNE